MPRTCTICTHDQRNAINAALVRNEPLRDIAGRYGTSKSSLERHKAEHLPAKLAKAHEANEVAHARTLLDEVRALRGKAVGILLTAERAGDLRTALLAIREARSCIELLAEMEGELQRNPQINITIDARWVKVRTLLMHTLAPYPDARAAVAHALEEYQE